jgi:hypothetical protein
MGLGDADIHREAALEAATHRVAVDRGDGDEARVHQRLEGGAEAGDEVAARDLVALEALQVGAGREELAAGPGDHRAYTLRSR